MTAEEAIKYLQEKVNLNEPVFVLRGCDKFTPECIRHWAGCVRWETGPTTKTASALDVAQQVTQWQLKYGSKVPD